MNTNLPELNVLYPAEWSELKIKYFEQIKHKKETPQALYRSTRYYLMKFDQFQNKPFWFDWNWPAFLGGSFWYGLRKLYSPVVIWLGLMIVSLLVTQLMYFTNLEFNTFNKIFFGAVSFFGGIIFGMIANRLYINKIMKRIELNKNPLKVNHPLGFLFSILALIIYYGSSYLEIKITNNNCRHYLIEGKKVNQNNFIMQIINTALYAETFGINKPQNIYTAAYIENPEAVRYLIQALQDPTFDPELSQEERSKILDSLSKMEVPAEELPEEEPVLKENEK